MNAVYFFANLNFNLVPILNIYTFVDVFAAMFSHRDTAEDKTNRVEISDVDEESLEQLLKFIYTDRIDEANLTTLACGLLTAADKYNVQR